MAASFPDLRCLLALPLALALLVALPATAQQQEITLDAASSDFDRRNERLVFQQVQIQQGELTIEAEQAETRDLDFSRGSWLFTGNVRISIPLGRIESDRATVNFADHRLTRATAEGAPARFERSMPGPEDRVVTGTANRIDFNVAKDELELAGRAELRDGVREVSGARLVYRIAEDRLIASADEAGEERVRIVITPPENDGSPPEEPPPEEDGDREQ